MLDVSIRIGLLNVMADLREQQGVSFLYITHDIASARYVSDRLMVMYAGHIVESGPTEEVLANPKHPYTQLLLSAVPDPRAPLSLDAITDKGEPPRVINPRAGLPVPLALPPRHRHLRHHHPAAARTGPGPLRRLPRRHPRPAPPARLNN